MEGYPESYSLEEGENRRVLVWIRDYEIGEGLSLSDEDNNMNIALFASADLIRYEEVVKVDKWRQAMDS